MKRYFLLILLFAFGAMNAQDTLGKHSRLKIVYSPKTVKDSVIPAGPNEFYLNIGPSLSMLQGAFAQNEANMTFMYKRVLKNPRYALRFGIAWKPQIRNYYFDYYNDNTIHTLRDHYFYYNETDTSRTKNVLDKQPVKKTQLNIGIEHKSRGHKRWTGFYGLDLVSGIYRDRYALYDIYEHKDSTGQWTAVNGATIGLLDYKQSNNFYFGLSPKAGLTYSFNSHWAISAQAAVLMTFDFTDYTQRNWDGNSINMQKATYYDFSFNGIMDELNLVYRF